MYIITCNSSPLSGFYNVNTEEHRHREKITICLWIPTFSLKVFNYSCSSNSCWHGIYQLDSFLYKHPTNYGLGPLLIIGLSLSSLSSFVPLLQKMCSIFFLNRRRKEFAATRHVWSCEVTLLFGGGGVSSVPAIIKPVSKGHHQAPPQQSTPQFPLQVLTIIVASLLHLPISSPSVSFEKYEKLS